MKIREVTHERVRNIGNYESVRVTLTAVLDDGDDHRKALDVLKDEAKAFLFPKDSPNERHDNKPTDSTDINY